MAIYVPHSKILIAGLSYVQPTAGVSYLQVKVTAEVTMPDVLAVEIITPVDSAVIAFGKSLADIEAVIDSTALTVGKSASDNISAVEDIQRIKTTKYLAETEVLLEALHYTFSKNNVADTSVVVDMHASSVDKTITPDYITASDAVTGKTVSKALADSVVMLDAVEAYRLYIRVFADDVTTPDAEYLSFVSGTTAETATTADVYNHAVTKNFAESTVLIDNMDGDIEYHVVKLISELVAANDAKVVDFATNKSDNVTSSDGGVLSMQDYCDITYFAEDYVGISRTF